MFDYSKLRGRIKELGFSESEIAKKINISKATISSRFNGNSEFSSKETDCLINLLQINDNEIKDYFFCKKGSE